MEHIQRHNKFITIGIAIVLFLVATLRLPVEIGHGRNFLLGLSQSGVIIVFIIVLFKINIWAALFFILSIVSSRVPSFTIESQYALKNVVLGLGWYYLIYTYADKKIIMTAICVIALAQFTAVFVQFFKIFPLPSGSIIGFTYNPNEASAMLALCFPAFLQDRSILVFQYKRLEIPIINTIGILMIIAGLFMVGSFGGILAVAVGSAFYLCLSGYHVYIIPVVTVLVIFFIFIDKPGASQRWQAWTYAYKMYLLNWEWGCGLGHWETISRKLVGANIHLSSETTLIWTRLHNTFLNALVEMGIGFAVLITGYLADTARKFKRKDIVLFTALIIIIVCCSVNSMFRMNAFNGMLAVTWLALLNKEIKGVTR